MVGETERDARSTGLSVQLLLKFNREHGCTGALHSKLACPEHFLLHVLRLTPPAPALSTTTAGVLLAFRKHPTIAALFRLGLDIQMLDTGAAHGSNPTNFAPRWVHHPIPDPIGIPMVWRRLFQMVMYNTLLSLLSRFPFAPFFFASATPFCSPRHNRFFDSRYVNAPRVSAKLQLDSQSEQMGSSGIQLNIFDRILERVVSSSR